MAKLGEYDVLIVLVFECFNWLIVYYSYKVGGFYKRVNLLVGKKNWGKLQWGILKWGFLLSPNFVDMYNLKDF